MTFSGLMSFITHTASSVSRTPEGGLPMVLTRSMSAFLSVSRAAMAALSAGIASARSASHSSFMPLALAATTSTSATTFSTMAFLGSMTSDTSLSMFTCISSASAFALISSGLSAVSSSCMRTTASPAVLSCFSPLS